MTKYEEGCHSSCKTLGVLLEGWPIESSLAGIPVRGLSLDSRRIGPGEVFVALAGQQAHGLRYANEAIRRGCAAVLHDADDCGDELISGLTGAPLIALPALEKHLGRLADRCYDSPSQDLTVVAVTGTNGKTSCSHYIAQALSHTGSAGVIGTLGWGIPPQLTPTTQTTPAIPETHRILDALRRAGCRTVAMEASSHGLHQRRLDGVRITGALYTNLTRDHLDYHGDMEAYLEAKLALLEAPGLEFVVFDANSPFAEPVLARSQGKLKTLAYSRHPVSGNALHPHLLLASTPVQDEQGLAFGVQFGGETAAIRVALPGDFNLQNTLATLGVLLALGHSLAEAAVALSRVRPVAGRMECYQGKSRNVVVDYAHTPDALGNVLNSVRPLCEGQLWLVFGCGGNRDQGKRPEMGAIAVRLADHVILTDDNPRTEDGNAIIEAILAGCGTAAPEKIRNRQAAIHYALEQMRPGDWLLVAGKGHEAEQEINGTRIPCSDRLIVSDWLRENDHEP
jgi:UDP-N-acetylmuramoyl-L-alanyl-D-glutamate--2,6-diaminopimelate ligase